MFDKLAILKGGDIGIRYPIRSPPTQMDLVYIHQHGVHFPNGRHPRDNGIGISDPLEE